ncbi:acetyltransferase [Synergistales bacterium]|nr:acetyltransferase [Synergistales bacterium]
MSDKLIICGAGGLGSEVKMLAEDVGGWELVGFLDDTLPAGSVAHGLPILGGGSYIEDFSVGVSVVIAVGSPQARESIHERMSRSGRVSFPKLIHPLACVAREAVLENGVCVFPFTLISSGAHIGQCAHLYNNVSVAHQAKIGAYSLVAPLAAIAGNVSIGRRVWIGAGASIKQGTAIGDDAVIGLGSAVINDIPANLTAAGNPARGI